MITVTEISLDEAQRLAALAKAFDEEVKKPVIISYSGLDFQIKGFIDAVCREKESGEVAWEVHQPNLITDFGRRRFFENQLASGQVFTSPSQDTPILSRYILPDAGSTGSLTQVSTNLSPSSNFSTFTKTLSTTFSTPSSSRTIGSIGLGFLDGTLQYAWCYTFSLITPAKTQTTTQTLEVVYNITLSPVA